MSSLSIRTRYALTLVTLIGIAGAIETGAFLVNRAGLTDLQDRSAGLIRIQGLARQLDWVIGVQHDALTDYLLSDDPGSGDRYRTARLDQARLEGSSAPVLASVPDLAPRFAAVQGSVYEWRTRFADPTETLLERGLRAQAMDVARLQHGSNLYDSVQSATTTLDEAVASLQAEISTDVERIETTEWRAYVLSGAVGMAAAVLAIWLLTRWGLRPIGRLLATARRAEAGEDVHFEVLRDDEIGRLAGELERMRAGLSSQTREAEMFGRFTELVALLDADGDVARATLDALSALASPQDGAVHLSDQSRSRAIPEGSIGPASAEIIALGHLSICPGVRRSARHVCRDLGAPLSARCPVYPAARGTLACIPLIALGDVVGVVHLHWEEPDALPLELGGALTRVVEMAALAIATRRMMAMLQGQAHTDSRTGLANSRTFDEALERRLAARDGRDPLALLMLDLDQFKAFNDRNGHPAGDQALRTFAGILRSVVRDDDLPARYGGEEFVVMLPGASAADGSLIAERIRAITESATIELSPGHSDRMSVSIGVAVWPDDAADRVHLLEAADAALYRAKNGGRNRVVLAGEAIVARAEEPRAAAGVTRSPGRVEGTPAPVPLPRAG